MSDNDTRQFTPVPKANHDHGACGHDHVLHGFHHHHISTKNLKVALALNLGFSLVEIVGGLWSGSLAVLSNAVHDLSDALAIALAYIFERMSQKRSNHRFSYGYRRVSLLSALVTCAFIITASVVVLAHAIPALTAPEQPKLAGMAGFALIGVAINGYAAFRLIRGGTMNERVVSWHMIEDVLGWVTVLLGTLVMSFWDLPIIDPILCILTSAFILWGVSRHLKSTLKLFLQAAPEGVDLPALQQEIRGVGGVISTHDAHLWSLDGESHVLTLHVVVASSANFQDVEAIKNKIRAMVAGHGRIHVTVEVESEAVQCPQVDCVQPT